MRFIVKKIALLLKRIELLVDTIMLNITFKFTYLGYARTNNLIIHLDTNNFKIMFRFSELCFALLAGLLQIFIQFENNIFLCQWPESSIFLKKMRFPLPDK